VEGNCDEIERREGLVKNEDLMKQKPMMGMNFADVRNPGSRS
jgi:hypothetical protein